MLGTIVQIQDIPEKAVILAEYPDGNITVMFGNGRLASYNLKGPVAITVVNPSRIFEGIADELYPPTNEMRIRTNLAFLQNLVKELRHENSAK